MCLGRYNFKLYDSAMCAGPPCKPVAMLKILIKCSELGGLSGNKYALELVLASKQDAF